MLLLKEEHRWNFKLSKFPSFVSRPCQHNCSDAKARNVTLELSLRGGWKKCENYKHFNEWKILFRGGCLALLSRAVELRVRFNYYYNNYFYSRYFRFSWSGNDLELVQGNLTWRGKWQVFNFNSRENLNSLFPYPFISSTAVRMSENEEHYAIFHSLSNSRYINKRANASGNGNQNKY